MAIRGCVKAAFRRLDYTTGLLRVMRLVLLALDQHAVPACLLTAFPCYLCSVHAQSTVGAVEGPEGFGHTCSEQVVQLSGLTGIN